MRTLKFKCTGQKLTSAETFSGIVPGSKGYLQIQVDFDTEWAEMAKVAEFWNPRNKDVHPAIIRNGMCAVPDEVTDAREIRLRIIGKHGDQKIITNVVSIRQGV